MISFITYVCFQVFASHTNLNVRNGTDADASRLYGRFRDLGFDTKLFADLTVREVNDKLVEGIMTIYLFRLLVVLLLFIKLKNE